MSVIKNIVISRPMRLLFLTLPLAFQVLPALAQSQSSGSLSLDAYLAELDRWSLAAAALKQNPERAAGMAKHLPREWQVTVNGQQFLVPTAWLARKLASIAGHPDESVRDSEAIQTRLTAMRTAAANLSDDSGARPSIAETKLAGILQQREFRNITQESWLERLLDRIRNWLGELLGRLFGTLGSRPSLKNFLLWVLVTTLVVLFMVWLARSLLGRKRGAGPNIEATDFVPLTWRNWARDALAAARRDDYREAIRHAYCAAVFRLAEVGVWQVDQARTHREYLHMLAADPILQLPLAGITSRFESVCYGGRTASASDFESVVTELEKLGCPLHWRPTTASS